MNDKQKIKVLVEKIEKCKNTISQERDSLRDLLYEFEELYENCEVGLEQIEEGIVTIKGGLDTISQTV